MPFYQGLWLVMPLSQEAFPIRNSFVPETGQMPWVAGRPFLSVTACGFLISLFVLHLKQYASIDPPPCIVARTYRVGECLSIPNRRGEAVFGAGFSTFW